MNPSVSPAPPTASTEAHLPVWKSVALLLLSVVLLTLAFAPVGQFYLAWIALTPLLLVVHRARTTARALLWSWLAGICFFTANMWWIEAINFLGLIALVAYCGLYWGLVGWLIRAEGVLRMRPIVAVPTIAAIWVAGEFVRGNILTGLPWLFIGHTQTPILPMCQIADALGVYGVSFWVVMVNAVLALWLIGRPVKSILPGAGLAAAAVAATLGYGTWRMGQPTGPDGPTVVVVQSNYPQSNEGEKGAGDLETLRFHVDQTSRALFEAGDGVVNLVVWSETMMPAMNRQSLIEMIRMSRDGQVPAAVTAVTELSRLASEHGVGILTGAHYCDKWADVQRDGQTYRIPGDSRNTAYLVQPDGTMDDRPRGRYDKIHLVPFGEFIPFKNSIPLLYKLFLALGPKYYSDYELQDGSDNGLTVFTLRDPSGAPRWRFVTPICFEDIDPVLCAAMFRPGPDGRKRADFIVNITNDGWFKANENVQHLQAAIFRDIENRVPAARSVNTGISGFIDSVGRTSRLLPARTTGTRTAQLELDDRVTLYTQWGDFFAWMCVVVAGAMAIEALGRRLSQGA